MLTSIRLETGVWCQSQSLFVTVYICWCPNLVYSNPKDGLPNPWILPLYIGRTWVELGCVFCQLRSQHPSAIQCNPQDKGLHNITLFTQDADHRNTWLFSQFSLFPYLMHSTQSTHVTIHHTKSVKVQLYPTTKLYHCFYYVHIIDILLSCYNYTPSYRKIPH